MRESKLSFTAALVLQSISAGYQFGFDIMDATALPSGTVYPTLRRLEQQELIQSSWEAEQRAVAEQRPARKYYKLTREGRQSLDRALERHALLEHLGTSEKTTGR